MGGAGLFLAGLALLVIGAEALVRGASRLATLLHISPMVIGLTIVSLGTSAPELAVGIAAARQGNGGMAVGNIAGTNVLNLLFILGLSALIRPLPLHSQIFRLELPMILVAAGLMMGLGWDGSLSQMDGLLMLTGGVIYTSLLMHITRTASRGTKKEFREEYGADAIPVTHTTWGWRILYLVMLVGGIALTVFGANLLVDGAVKIARAVGVSDTIIGLTIVAMGTSAPELVTTLVATLRNDRDVAVGNLLGSSIYNILVILSITCLASPGGLPVERQLMMLDVPLMTLVAFGAVPVFWTGYRVSRLEGGAGVAIYLVYLMWLVFFRA